MILCVASICIQKRSLPKSVFTDCPIKRKYYEMIIFCGTSCFPNYTYCQWASNIFKCERNFVLLHRIHEKQQRGIATKQQRNSLKSITYVDSLAAMENPGSIYSLSSLLSLTIIDKELFVRKGLPRLHSITDKFPGLVLQETVAPWNGQCTNCRCTQMKGFSKVVRTRPIFIDVLYSG